MHKDVAKRVRDIMSIYHDERIMRFKTIENGRKAMKQILSQIDKTYDISNEIHVTETDGAESEIREINVTENIEDEGLEEDEEDLNFGLWLKSISQCLRHCHDNSIIFCLHSPILLFNS